MIDKLVERKQKEMNPRKVNKIPEGAFFKQAGIKVIRKK